MANVNRVTLIGRCTRDPEVKIFSNGGMGFVVNNKRKNAQTGQYEDDPVFLDVEAFNRQQGQKMADLIEQNVRKGTQLFIEGHLKLDQWTAQDGTKRSKIGVVVDSFQFLDPKGGERPAPRNDEADEFDPRPPVRVDEEIAF